MNRYIKLHYGLIKFLQVELKKKRTSKEFVFFLRDILKAYFSQLIRLYNDMFLIFDVDYRRSK